MNNNKTELWCKYFALGKCTAGNRCPYSHNIPREEINKAIEQEKLALSQIVCKYFQGGFCHSGNRCKFLHEEEKK